MTIEINYDGVNALKTMCGQQAGHLGASKTFATDHCSNAPFETGLLFNLFAGEYKTAYTTMTASLEQAEKAGERIRNTIKENVERYKRLDVGASKTLKTLEGEVDETLNGYSAPVAGPATIPMPLWVKHTTGLSGIGLDTFNEMGTYHPRHLKGKWPGPWAGPGDAIDGVNNTIDTINAGLVADDGFSDQQSYQEWLARHRKKK